MTLLNTALPLFTDFYTHSVALRDDLSANAWETETNLYCDEIEWVGNDISTAKLSLEIGAEIMHPGESDEVSHKVLIEQLALELRGKYVRVTIPQPDIEPEPGAEPSSTDKVWYGYITGQWNERDASKAQPDPDDNKLTGRKRLYMAVGLEYFLDRVQIGDAVVAAPGDVPDYIRIQRPLIFNGDASVNYDASTVRRGNRHPVAQLDEEGAAPDAGEEDYAFADGSATPVLWSLKDIIRHLCRYHQPLNNAGERAPCRYKLGEVASLVTESIFPTVECERKTFLQILKDTMDPQRGLSFWVTVAWEEGAVEDEGEFVATIDCDSRATAEITLPGGGSLQANSQPTELNFDGNIAGNIDPQRDLASIEYKEDQTRYYDQVIVRGARMTTTASFGIADGTLEPDWSTDLEDTYKAAIGAVAAVNDNYRKDEKFTSVYSWFRIPTDWDGQTGDGMGVSPMAAAIPDIAPDGTIGAALPIHPDGLRVLNATRMLVGYNYAVTPDAPTEIHDIPAGSTPDFLKPYAWFGYEPAGGGAQYLRLSDKIKGSLGPVGDVEHAYNLAVQQNAPGIILMAAHGKLNHTLAGDRWAATTAATASNVGPEVGFEAGGPYDTLFACTVTLEADRYAEGKWPEDLTGMVAGKPAEILTVYAGDKYRLDFLAGNTVLFLDHSGGDSAAILAGGGIIRNDQQYLQDMARLAYEWYQTGRQPVTIKHNHLKDCYRLGMFITTIGEGSTAVTVNSMVTRIKWDLEHGTQTIQTDDQDFDFA